MCRLYADKGKKESGVVDLLVGFQLKREEVEVIEREVREHREWQRKHGYDVIGGEYTEKDLIRYAVNRYIEELREKERDKILGEFNPVQVEDAYQKAGWTGDGTRDAITRRLQSAEALW